MFEPPNHASLSLFHYTFFSYLPTLIKIGNIPGTGARVVRARGRPGRRSCALWRYTRCTAPWVVVTAHAPHLTIPADKSPPLTSFQGNFGLFTLDILCKIGGIRADEPRDGRWSWPPIDINSTGRTANALSLFLNSHARRLKYIIK